jgi:hypothetical protein
MKLFKNTWNDGSPAKGFFWAEIGKYTYEITRTDDKKGWVVNYYLTSEGPCGGYEHGDYNKLFKSAHKAAQFVVENPVLPITVWNKWNRMGHANAKLNKPLPTFPTHKHYEAYVSGLKWAINKATRVQ